MPDFVLDNVPSGSVAIKVIGVGGGGCNAVDSCFNRGLNGVEFVVVNSDIQALKRTRCPNRIQIGAELTRGRGCGADPKLGEQCMIDAKDVMLETLRDTELVFIAAGLGGGTGTGAAPMLAQIARELGILTVGVVTTPFKFEGPRRTKSCVEGIERMREHCDTLIVINNNRLLDVVGPRVPLREAFSVADSVLADAVQAISDLIATPCLVNLDFNDVRTIMGGRGGAVMGIGVGKGENRAQEAVKKATSSPLLDKLVIDGATGILVCITGGMDMTLAEVDEAVSMVTEMADPDVNVIFGAGMDETLSDQMRVTLIATGFREDMQAKREAEENRHRSMRTEGRSISTARSLPAPKIPDLNIALFDEMDSKPAASAPVAQRPQAPQAPVQRPVAQRPSAPVAPAPSASAEDALDAMFQAPPAPAAPAAAPSVRANTLRSALERMMEEQDAAPAAPTTSVNALASAVVAAAERVSAQSAAAPKATPAAQYNVRPAPRPGNAPARPASPPAAQPAEPVGVTSPSKVTLFEMDKVEEAQAEPAKSGTNFELPAFMRRKGLFE